MLISYTKFHPDRSVNVASMVRNSLMFPQESVVFAALICVIQNTQRLGTVLFKHLHKLLSRSDQNVEVKAKHFVYALQYSTTSTELHFVKLTTVNRIM
jgi:hypothetical protein